MWGFAGAGFSDSGLQIIENRVAAADRLQVAFLEVDQIGQAGGEFQFPIRKFSLKLCESGLLAVEFLGLGSCQLFRWEQ